MNATSGTMIATYAGTVVVGADAPRTAQIHVRAEGLVATTDDGAEHAIVWSELALEAGGYEGDFIFCRPRAGGFTITTSAPGFVDAIRTAGSPIIGAELEKVRGQKRKRRTGGLISLAVFIVFLVAAGAFLWSLPGIVASSIEAVPTRIDAQMGAAAMSEMELPGPVVRDPVLQGFVEGVVGRLAPHAQGEWDFEVQIVDADVVNAFALPGGKMVVFTGLIDRATSPDQVAGVLAHEMAHVTRRHGMRNVAHQMGIALALRIFLGDVEGWTAMAAELAIMAKANDYSREQESDADAEGTRMLLAAGLDPEGLAQFFDIMKAEPGSEMGGAMSWLSTHPEHDARIAHVRELARTLPSAVRRPLEVDWPAVKAALPATD